MPHDVTDTSTKAYLMAEYLSKNGPTSRAELMELLGADPSVYVALYDCFERVGRGMYTYTGSNEKLNENKNTK